MRRYWKIPEAQLQEFERLIRETDLSASECARRVGICLGGDTGHARPIVRKYRRYISQYQWIDRLTGKVRPSVCTTVCAAHKTGLSKRTIRRRIQAGLISPLKAPSQPNFHAISDAEIAALKDIGKLKSGGGWRVKLTRDDIIAIRELAATGLMGWQIHPRYPSVSRRQINRIIAGDRWKDIPK